jgi:threonine aldolase
MTLPVDLRSDTVTQPDDAMRAAMAAAEVGDDVLEGDPTVRALEERVAELLGKDAGVFVASGTMGNLVALLSHRVAGRAVLAGARMHVQNWEGGGHAVLVGAPLALLDEGPDGVPDPAAVAARAAVDDPHVPLAGLGWVENTHGGMGGMPVEAGAVARVRAALPGHLPLHCDGARLVDAAIALDTTPAALVADADSSTLCLSKGLGCPVGTVLVGSGAFAVEARRARKVVGGAMRQSGVLAAAGLHALAGAGWERTQEEVARAHAQARRLADALAGCARVGDVHDPTQPYDPTQVRTNLVRFGVRGDRRVAVAALWDAGVWTLSYGQGIRAVTHRRLTDAQVDAAIEVVRRVLG